MRHVKCFWVSALIIVAGGCEQPSMPAKAPQPSITSDSTASPSHAPATDDEVPPDIVKKVDALIELNSRYCELSMQIQDAGAFREHADELSRLDQESSSVTEDIMIAEAKLSPTQKAALDRDHFMPRAQPSIDKKRQEKERVLKLAN